MTVRIVGNGPVQQRQGLTIAGPPRGQGFCAIRLQCHNAHDMKSTLCVLTASLFLASTPASRQRHVITCGYVVTYSFLAVVVIALTNTRPEWPCLI
jgi:hypothetical protein